MQSYLITDTDELHFRNDSLAASFVGTQRTVPCSAFHAYAEQLKVQGRCPQATFGSRIPAVSTIFGAVSLSRV